ncbi:activating signal cointegrator 1 [Anopheles merus]|uniref:activating signal cointegrator 1 n=1 Tax=Anopheles merus TaxID=30066 RepID=UPI001BE4B7F9|nr:activating signal cointegrator 1 [Anopheles merus]
MNQWIKEELSKCLHFDIPDDLIAYIHTIQNAHEIDGYFRTLLDYNNPQHTAFIRELKVRLGHDTPDGLPVMKPLTTGKSAGKSKQQPSASSAKQQQQQQQTKPSKANPPTSGASSSKPTPPAPEASGGGGGGGSKKKTKYVNLYGQDGELADVVLLKGRHHCDCQAGKHRLVNNCLHCGRIVCEQEGSGPCLFCGSLVCTEHEQRLIESASRKGDSLRRTLMEQNRPAGWEEALATRNRLLEYDRNSEKRTTVIDDEADYFKTHSVWLSDAERKKLEQLEEELREKRHASRLARKVTLDFAGRRVLDEAALSTEDVEEILRQASLVEAPVSGGGRGKENVQPPGQHPTGQDSEDVHPTLIGPAPTFVDVSAGAPAVGRPASSTTGYDGVYSRVQDKEFLQMSDLRHCLSMHQPWASLLVAGIKRHEGRTWYSSHRGRLWIAATAKPADPETIRELECFYRTLYGDEAELQFPTQYPAGCLLGCVSVQDCLPQEEYRKQHPNGESDSPFVFVCEEPQELPIRFPVRGDHKIYMLDSGIHQAAVKALQRLAKQNKQLAD